MNRWLAPVARLLLLAAVLAVATWGAVALFSPPPAPPPRPPEGCVVGSGDNQVGIDLEQSANSAIIAGITVQRGLPARAASIALATAWQESGLRNLNYGDRDSVGLFQQRPSQGWGTEQQIMDPRYSTGKFLDALVKVPNWQTRDINDVAQAVQRSGYPNAYRQHVEAAKALASALTGQSTTALSCVNRDTDEGDAAGLARSLSATYGTRISVSVDDDALVIKGTRPDIAWSAAAYALAQTGRFGTASVQVANQEIEVSGTARAPWTAVKGSPDDLTVGVVVRSP